MKSLWSGNGELEHDVGDETNDHMETKEDAGAADDQKLLVAGHT